MDSVKEFTNLAYLSADLDQIFLVNKPITREDSDISLVRQNLFRNLFVHTSLFEFLKNNLFLLNNVT